MKYATAILCGLLLPGVAPAQDMPTIRRLCDLRSALWENTQANGMFDVTGHVIACSASSLGFALSDGSAGYIFSSQELNPGLRRGDYVRAIGTLRCRNAYTPPIARATKIEIVGHEELAKPAEMPPELIAGGRLDFSCLRVRGVVHSCVRDAFDQRWNWMILLTPEAAVKIALAEAEWPLVRLSGLTDAEIAVDGVVSPNFGLRHASASHLSPISTNALEVIKPAPSAPFSAPYFTPSRQRMGIRSLEELHRRRVIGRVLATWNGDTAALAIADGKSVFLRLAPNQPLPDVGSCIDAVGFPSSDNFAHHFTETLWRTCQGPEFTSPAAVAVSVPDFFREDDVNVRQVLQWNGLLVRVSGRIIDIASRSDRGVTSLKCGNRIITVESGALDPDALPTVGCTVEVTGVLVIEPVAVHRETDYAHAKNIKLVARSDKDFIILARPPWFTTARLTAIIGVLLALLTGILIWNRTLSHLIVRRGRALMKEEIAHAKAIFRTDERMRIAADLHDSVTQNLTGASLQIAAARSACMTHPEATTRHLDHADQILRSCRTELRRCIWDLRNDSLEDPDFNRAIRTTAEPVLGTAELAVRFNVPRSRLSDLTAHTVMSITRELISNAVRHGAARHVAVAGELRDGRLRFSVKDDGCGFDPATRPTSSDGHFGLDGISERLARFGGTAEFASQPYGGTRVVVSLFPPTDQANKVTT